MTSPMHDKRIVTFKQDPGSDYGVVSCSWEDAPRKTRIAKWAVQNFAEGWNAELVVEGGW